MQKIKKTIHTIKTSWTYRNPQIIIIATLAVVIAVQNTTLIPNVHAAIKNAVPDNSITVSKPNSDTVPCDYKCLTVAWVNLRTEEILEENRDNYRRQARVQALTEANNEFKDIINNQ